MWNSGTTRQCNLLVLLFECVRKKVIGKPCEGELHARFDEGVVGENPLLYSTGKSRMESVPHTVRLLQKRKESAGQKPMRIRALADDPQ